MPLSSQHFPPLYSGTNFSTCMTTQDGHVSKWPHLLLPRLVKSEVTVSETCPAQNLWNGTQNEIYAFLD